MVYNLFTIVKYKEKNYKKHIQINKIKNRSEYNYFRKIGTYSSSKKEFNKRAIILNKSFEDY